ncbi:MAG: N-acetylmuramate alpha-1-phosphate uridylyltransferase MurU [Janthinobacterium lividum]
MNSADPAPVAMIFAAGRGERMRPLTDTQPKPLLEVGGKPLIVWQIEALARAGFTRQIINHAWLGEQFEKYLGDGTRYGVTLQYSAEGQALETAGGIVQALPLIAPDGVDTWFAAVSADIHTDYDYRQLMPRIHALRAGASALAMHLVLVPNPAFHPRGDFDLVHDRVHATDSALAEAAERLTFGNIGLYHTRLFRGIVPGTRLPLGPLIQQAARAGQVSGERYDGGWDNVGTPAQLRALDSRLKR